MNREPECGGPARTWQHMYVQCTYRVTASYDVPAPNQACLALDLGGEDLDLHPPGAHSRSPSRPAVLRTREASSLFLADSWVDQW